MGGSEQRRRTECGKSISVPEFVVTQAQISGDKSGEEKQEKVARWSTKMLEEVTSKREFEDTEEMVQCRSINQEEVDTLWTE